MALPTLQDAKDYLRIDTTAEDGLVTALLARAKASIETWLGYPIIAASRTVVTYDRLTSDTWISLPGPFASSPTPVFTDTGGVTVDTSSYVLDGRSGKVRASYNGHFGPGPYTVTATIGLSAHPDYAIRLESIASTAILDLVSHYYENRNPAITADSGSTFSFDGIPPRIQSDLMLLPNGGWAVA